jgi:uncharacterized membrane protein YdjX (TVP38/TMEM64 family)
VRVPSRTSFFRLAALLTAVIVIGAIWRLRWAAGIDASDIAKTAADFGEWAPAIFVLVYALLCLAAVPTLPLNLVAGAAWGWLGGGMISCFGGTLGAVIAFAAGRYILGRPLATRSEHATIARIQSRFERSGWKFVVFTRVNPIFPSFLLNYGFGLTSLSFGSYALGTFLGFLPPSIAVAWIGENMRTLSWNLSPQQALSVIALISAGVTVLFAMRFFARTQLPEEREIK